MKELNRLAVVTIAILLFVLFVNVPASAQHPNWVKSYGSETPYPDHRYLTGFGMSTITSDQPVEEFISQAVSDAQQNLIQKIRVQVESLTTSFLEETQDSFSSQFMSATKTSASLQLTGMSTENHVDRRGNMVYALANVSKEQVRDQFLDAFNDSRDNFNNLRASGNRNLSNGNSEVALEQFMAAKSAYSEMMESWSIVQSIERSTRSIIPTDWNPDKVRDQVSEIDQNIEQIINRPIRSIDDATWWLANTMATSEDQNFSVNINAITYRDSGISSEFANYVRQLLTRQLGNRTSWKIQDIGGNYDRNPSHVLTGTFWDRSDGVHVLVNVRDISTGQIVAASEVSIPDQVVEDSGLELLPENYEQAIADLKALQTNSGDSRGLQLQAWTNRGENNLVFVEGEIMEVSLQVNLPSYIRILYHLKDGTRVLLLDSHYINPRDVNKPYTLPYRFECVAPFGVESMQVIAQSEPFERIETRVIDGIPYLTEDLDAFLANTRGFVMVKEEAQQTEKILTITTMPRR